MLKWARHEDQPSEVRPQVPHDDHLARGNLLAPADERQAPLLRDSQHALFHVNPVPDPIHFCASAGLADGQRDTEGLEEEHECEQLEREVGT